MDELSDFQKQYLESLRQEEKEELANHAEQINSFTEFMKGKGVHLDEENFKYLQTIGIVAIYPNIINHLHPSLCADKEGLFVFNSLCQNF